MLLDLLSLNDAPVDAAPLGTLSVLNIGAGDLKFSFDKTKPRETARAKQTIEDMLRRGYTLLVEIDGEMCRAKGFDPEREEYIIVDPPEEPEPTPDAPIAASPTAKRPRGRPRGVPASQSRATAIAPTGGG